jgi:hypothetical protein
LPFMYAPHEYAQGPRHRGLSWPLKGRRHKRRCRHHPRSCRLELGFRVCVLSRIRVGRTLIFMYAPFHHPNRTARGMQGFRIMVYGLMPEHCHRFVWRGELPSRLRRSRTLATHGQLVEHPPSNDVFCLTRGNIGGLNEQRRICLLRLASRSAGGALEHKGGGGSGRRQAIPLRRTLLVGVELPPPDATLRVEEQCLTIASGI